MCNILNFIIFFVYFLVETLRGVYLYFFVYLSLVFFLVCLNVKSQIFLLYGTFWGFFVSFCRVNWTHAFASCIFFWFVAVLMFFLLEYYFIYFNKLVGWFGFGWFVSVSECYECVWICIGKVLFLLFKVVGW